MSKQLICQKGTLARQGELKKLPVPELANTIPKWLKTTKPHLSPSEFENTKGKLYDCLTNREEKV